MRNFSSLLNANAVDYTDEISQEDYMNLFLSALSEEFGAWYFYLISKDSLVGPEHKQIEELFEENGKDELEDHAYWLIDRIGQLGGSLAKVAVPSMWNNMAEHQYIRPEFNSDGNIDTSVIIESAIQSELDAIETYKKLVAVSEILNDTTSNEKFKDILSDEEEHLANLQDIYKNLV